MRNLIALKWINGTIKSANSTIQELSSRLLQALSQANDVEEKNDLYEIITNIIGDALSIAKGIEAYEALLNLAEETYFSQNPVVPENRFFTFGDDGKMKKATEAEYNEVTKDATPL